jgi:hypothetical protein
MPDWWLEATLPTVAFLALFVLWIVLPARPGESDLGSKIRDLFKKR